MSGPRPVRAPRGTTLTCRGWQQEAVMRMLMNNLDPEVAERPDDLVVYGGTGRAARSWEAFDAIVASLRALENDETLLVQSGKPVAVFRTHTSAPRVLIANSNLVGRWATWEHFRELERQGLMMYGQMTAGSWIYIGSQGIVQGTYETFGAVARRHFDGTLAGRLVVTAGLGGMGGAQPLAITMNEGVALIAEVEEWRIDKRIETKYLDEKFIDIDAAIDKAVSYKQLAVSKSIGILCNAVDLLKRLVERNIIPDTLTDQTSAHDPLIGYVPHTLNNEQAKLLRQSDPAKYTELAYQSMYLHVKLMMDLKEKGAVTFDYGNNIRARALEYESKHVNDLNIPSLEVRGLFPGFVPAYIRPLFCLGKGPFRWAALSGDAQDIAVTDEVIANMFPENASLQRWLHSA